MPLTDLHPDSPPAPATANAPLSVIVGDRLCNNCGYNLVGQTITREPHYHLFITRCPECGTVAALQEYPQLGRWANRWAAVLAGAWLLFTVLALFASGAAIFGISVGGGEIAIESYTGFLSAESAAWSNAHTVLNAPPPVPAPMPPAAITNSPLVTVTSSRTPSGFLAFWNAQDHSELLAKAGGLFGVIDWWSMSLLAVGLTIVAFLFGCFWAAILLGRKALGRCLIGFIILIISCAFGSILFVDSYTSVTSYPWVAAQQQVGIPWLYLCIAFASLPLMLGLIVGRKLVRGLITLLLPPRFRSSLAMLWITDGLAPPKPR